MTADLLLRQMGGAIQVRRPSSAMLKAGLEGTNILRTKSQLHGSRMNTLFSNAIGVPMSGNLQSPLLSTVTLILPVLLPQLTIFSLSGMQQVSPQFLPPLFLVSQFFSLNYSFGGLSLYLSPTQPTIASSISPILDLSRNSFAPAFTSSFIASKQPLTNLVTILLALLQSAGMKTFLAFCTPTPLDSSSSP